MKKTWKYNYDISVLTREDALSFYLLGVFMSDGCINSVGKSYKVEISSKDHEWLVNIGKLLIVNFEDYHFSAPNVLVLCSKKIENWLIAKGCIARKSLILQMPNVPDEYLADFLRGIFDGDGSISKTHFFHKQNNKYYDKWNCYITSSSLELVNSLHTILLRLNIKNTIFNCGKNKSWFASENRYIISNNDNYRVCFNGKSICDLINFIYYDKNVLSLDRKYLLGKECISYYHNKPPHMWAKYTYLPDQELKLLISKNGLSAAAKEIGVSTEALRQRAKRRKLI